MLLKKFSALGTVDVTHAKIGGQLDCTGVTLLGAGSIYTAGEKGNQKGGEKDMALLARRLVVERGFLFHDFNEASSEEPYGRRVSVTGKMYLHGGHVGDLLDDVDRWPKGEREIGLAGFTYNRFGISAQQTFAARKNWLSQRSESSRFYPQPYTQLAKVLKGLGNAPEARKVLYERDSLLADATLRNIRKKPDGNRYLAFESPVIEFRTGIHLVVDRMSRWVIGYGHKPWRSLIALFALFAAATTLAHYTWENGSFAPNSDVILTSPAWLAVEKLDCVANDDKGNRLPPAPKCIPNPADTWSKDPAGGLDWDSFNRYGYAADLVIPILDLGQTDAWAPSKDRGGWGKGLWWGRWVLAALGWLVTALGVAAITGIMQRNSPEA